VILFILCLVVLVSGCTAPNSNNNTSTSSKLKDSIDGKLNITLESYSTLKNDTEFKKLASNTIYNKLTPYGSTDKEVLNIILTSVSDSKVDVKVQAYDTVTRENYNLEITFNRNNGRWSIDETTGNMGSWT
jgi:ABC-type Fe3+-citrate transport system substrate-binding protein